MNQLFFKSSCTGNYLKNRTRIIQLRNSLVLPLLFSGSCVSFCIRTTGKRLQRSRCLFIKNFRRIVQIKRRCRCHCINGARLCIHNDAAGTIGHFEFAHHLSHTFFQVILQRNVQRQIQRIAIFGIVGCGIPIGHFFSVGSLRGNNTAVYPCQIFLILIFQTILTIAISVGKANDGGSQFILWVIPFCSGLCRNTGQIQIIKVFQNGICCILFHLLFQDVIPSLCLKALCHIFCRNVQLTC